MKIVDRDNGYRDLMRRMRDLGKGAPFAEVGILATEGAAEHRSTPGATLFEIAEQHEFGLGVPERSFIRAFFDEHEAEARRFLSKLLADSVRTREERSAALHKFGIWLVAMCQKRIRAGIAPENSPMTQRLKGSSTPLIDTGQLWTSITFRTSDEEQRPQVEAGTKAKSAEQKKTKDLQVKARAALKSISAKLSKEKGLSGKERRSAARAAKKAAKGLKG